MLATSSRFLDMLRTPHLVSVRATLKLDNPSGPDPDPVVVPVLDGTVTADETASTVRTGSLTIPWSTAAESEAALGIDLRQLPFGWYVQLERGVRYADGSLELLPLGMLRINAVSWQTSDKVATLDLADRMAQLADTHCRPRTPISLKPSNLIVDLVDDVFGSSISYTVGTDPATEPPLVGVTFEGNYADVVGELAASVDARAYFDPEGNFVLAPRVTEPDETAVWDVDAGEEGVLVDADESLDRTSTYSRVAVRGMRPNGTALERVAYDNDPASPTFIDGPFGRVTLVYESESVQTTEQGDKLAASLLASHRGLARTLTVATVPNPALEPSDTVLLRFPDGRQEFHLVSALTLPLDATSAMQLVTKTPGTPAAAPSSLRAQAALATMMAAP